MTAAWQQLSDFKERSGSYHCCFDKASLIFIDLVTEIRILRREARLPLEMNIASKMLDLLPNASLFYTTLILYTSACAIAYTNYYVLMYVLYTLLQYAVKSQYI